MLASLDGWTAVGISLGLISIIGIPLTWVLARRGRQTPELRHATDFDILLDRSDGVPKRGLRMATSEHEIDRISRTRIAFWNARGDTVLGDHVVQSDPLRLELHEGDSALNVRVISSSRSQIALETTVVRSDNRDQVMLHFDFLDASDGGVVEILHQGFKPALLVGTVRGARMRQIKGIGGISLSNVALRSLAQRSRLRRMLVYSNRRFRVVVVTMLIYFFVLGFLLRGLAVTPRRLVDPSLHELTTLEGQRKFAEEVSDVGLPPDGIELLMVMMVLYVILTLAFMWYMLSPRVPPSLIHLEDLPPEDNSGDAAKVRSRRRFRRASN